MPTLQLSCGHSPALPGTEDRRASQEPLSPFQSPGLFLEPLESKAVPRSASCLPRVKRSAVLLPPPPPCPQPAKQDVSWLKSLWKGKAAGHVPHPQTSLRAWGLATASSGCCPLTACVWTPSVPPISVWGGAVSEDSGEVPACLALGCLPGQGKGSP